MCIYFQLFVQITQLMNKKNGYKDYSYLHENSCKSAKALL